MKPQNWYGLSVISFTQNGARLAKRLAQILGQEQEGIFIYTKCRECIKDSQFGIPVKTPAAQWAGERMREKSALLFIGACGIAVRSIAPFVTDKLQDAPVLVMDEQGRYVIPVLSGHMGGANELALYLAEKTGAAPVITTATDLNRKFAVDLFAKQNGLWMENKEGIVKVSSKILAGMEVTVSIETGHIETGHSKGAPPQGVRLVPYPPREPVDIVVTSELLSGLSSEPSSEPSSGQKTFAAAALLKPKQYVLGVGCRKGKSYGELDAFIRKHLDMLGIQAWQVYAIASIVQKKGEPGLLEWSRKNRAPFLTYTAQELKSVDGEFSESAFVKGQVGVGNVCERAAVKACGESGGCLLLHKQAENGMTLAIAKREWKVCFYGE